MRKLEGHGQEAFSEDDRKRYRIKQMKEKYAIDDTLLLSVDEDNLTHAERENLVR